MKQPLIALLLSALVVTVDGADAPPVFPLLGLWRVSAATSANGEQAAANEQMELEFLPDGVLIITAASPASGIMAPVRMHWRYTFQPPNVVTYTLSGTPVERQRFAVSGDSASFEHLDYKTSSRLRRIKKTEFRDQPKDIKVFPK